MTEIVYTPNPPPTVIHAPGAPGITWKKDGSVLATAGRVSTVDVTGPGVEASIVGTSLVLAFAGGAGGGLANTAPLGLGTASPGTAVFASRADHVHPLPAPPTPADIGLDKVDNTSDADKPVSTAQAAAIAAAQAAAIAASDPAGAADAVLAALGSAAMASTSDFATAAQGALAATALQPAAIGVSVASLVGGVLPTSQIPAIAISEFLGRVDNEEEMLALEGQKGDWTIRNDLSTTWIIIGDDPTVVTGWTQLEYPTMPSAVTSVNSQVGAVVLGPADVGADPAGAAAAAQAASAPLGHTHTTTEISDATATGRSLMTAANGPAARAAIGAGTSNFSGAYADLSGLPSVVLTGDSRLSDAREWTAATVSQSDAELGTSTARYAWTPERVKQAITALGGVTPPTVSTRLFDDFLSGFVTTLATGMGTIFPATRSVVVSLSNTTGAAATQDTELGAPGLLVLNTGTASNGYARLCSTNGAVVKLGGGEVRFKQRFKIPVLANGTDDFFVQIGLFNAFIGATDGVRVYCRASENSGKWIANTFVGGTGYTGVNTTTSPAAGVYTTIEGVINASATEFKVYIDGALAAVVTDPLPTVALAHMTLLIKSAGTTARTAAMDYHELVMTQPR